ncbi:MAG: hypothetical protein C0184_03695 [Chloroflexus aggregans]|uniref:Uncharacterized protein n=1 Tax=Chloroflexus aggregans TaxID=152260 RepID=A0A2J6XAA8_9CHLR|nr:MAG: hypothetical protein C0184_03695 [Chloroflexus aggregans]
MRSLLFGCLCCLTSLVVGLGLGHTWPSLRESVATLTRPYREPTFIIRELLDAVEHDPQTAVVAFAGHMQRPASLHLLLAEWQHAHHPPSFVLGPYRRPTDWPIFGMELVIPLRFACHRGQIRLDVVVVFTPLGWQVYEIRSSQ